MLGSMEWGDGDLFALTRPEAEAVLGNRSVIFRLAGMHSPAAELSLRIEREMTPAKAACRETLDGGPI